MNLRPTVARGPERRTGSWDTCAGICRSRWPRTCDRSQLHKADVSVKVDKVSTAPTAIPSEKEKTLGNGSFPGGRSAGGTYGSGR
jgi:hypothetical protein